MTRVLVTRDMSTGKEIRIGQGFSYTPKKKVIFLGASDIDKALFNVNGFVSYANPKQYDLKITWEDFPFILDCSNICEWAVKYLPRDEVDHYRSDLYIKKTPMNEATINELWTRELSMPPSFISQIDKSPWYEFPMCAMAMDLAEKEAFYKTMAELKKGSKCIKPKAPAKKKLPVKKTDSKKKPSAKPKTKKRVA